MLNLLNISAGGLQVAAQRLAVSSRNVANSTSSGYNPQRLEVEEKPDLAGVEASAVESKNKLKSDSQTVNQMDSNILELSRTDLVKETVEQSLAATSFRANLQSLQIAEETLQSLVDIKS